MLEDTGQVFRRGQRHLGGDQTFHHRVIRHVEEHHHMVQNAALREGGAEVFRHVVFHTHGGEHDGELLVGILSQGGLAHDLRRQLVMRKSVSGKDRQLLAADQGGQAVDGRDPGADIVSGIFPGHGI